MTPHRTGGRLFGSATIIVAVIVALFSAAAFEAAHAGEAAFTAGDVEVALHLDHDDNSPSGKALHVGHCAAHCAGQAMSSPPPDAEPQPALYRARWARTPPTRRPGLSPAMQDQPPRV